MKTFYIYRPTKERVDCAGVAYDEEGNVIHAHASSGYEFFLFDMGLSANSPHYVKKKYEEAAGGEIYDMKEVIGKEALQALIDEGKIRNLTFE